MGRTNIVIDEQLIQKAMTLTGAKTKRNNNRSKHHGPAIHV